MHNQSMLYLNNIIMMSVAQSTISTVYSIVSAVNDIDYTVIANNVRFDTISLTVLT